VPPSLADKIALEKTFPRHQHRLSVSHRPSTGANRYELVFARFMAVFVTLVQPANPVGVDLFMPRGMTLPISIVQ
jgi:hypothetical protein